MAAVPCSLCSQSFNDVFTLNLHMRVFHQGCQVYLCKANYCNRSFGLFPSFRKHLQTFHNVPARLITKDAATLMSSPSDSVVPINDASCILPSLSADNVDSGSDQEKSDNLSGKGKVDYFQLLKKQEDIFVAKLYSNPSFPRNLVDKCIADVSDYLRCPFFDHMKEVVSSFLDPNLSSIVKQHIDKMFEAFMNPFGHLKTESNRFTHFEESGDFIRPESYVIASRDERVKTKTGVALRMRDVTGQFIPLRHVFKNLFELPHVLLDTLEYMEKLKGENEWVSNFVQCEVWKRKISNFSGTDVVIPVNVYYDGCEPNNALGPHQEPLGCTYVHIPVLPPAWNSRLENIFLALLFDDNNRSLYGNYKTCKPLIEELLFLETEGITVNIIEHGSVKLYFAMGLVLGDNKGLNGVCGFVESFSANHYCRICMCPKDAADSLLEEDPILLRTPDNYAEQVALKNPSVTGIKEQCIFSRLPSFQVPTDIAVDVFHDLIEGVVHYTMISVLQHFHSVDNMFLASLNNRLYSADLGVDSDNRPPAISADRLSKDKLKMTGAETYTFVRLFGALVYDLIRDKNDKFHQLYLLLHDIVSITHAKGLPRDAGEILKLKVREHNQMYMKLTKVNLKPKFHMLLHYSRLLDLFGPFSLMSTIRLEAKHRVLKLTSNSCFSRRNLSKTVAIKHQLGFCYRSICNSSLRQPLEMGHLTLLDLKECNAYPSFSLSLPHCVFSTPLQNVASWICLKGTKYEPRKVLVSDVDECGLFRFVELELILVQEDDSVLFIVSPLETLGYFSEVRGYEVKRENVFSNWFCVKQESLLDPCPLSVFLMSSGESVVVLKNHL